MAKDRPASSREHETDVQSTHVRSASLALAALVFAACQLPAPQSTRFDSSPSPAAPPLAPDRVPLRLAEVEGAERIDLEGLWGPLTIERVGNRVRASDGREGSSLVVEPGYDGIVRFRGRAYPGAIVVEPGAERGLRATADLPLEEYIAGVVAAELVLWSALPAELEAQAVAARSYGLASLAARGHRAFLWSDTRDQVYRGRFEPTADAGSQRAAAQLTEAVRRSEARVLVREGAVLDARFHAACGGFGAAFADAFPMEAPWWARPGEGGATCEPCRRIGAAEEDNLPAPSPERGGARGRVRWTLTIDAAGLERLARELDLGPRVLGLRPTRVDEQGRWLECELTGSRGTARIELNELRRLVGYDKILSGCIVRTWPRLGDELTTGLFLEGLGRGHGVGLCQIGARELAAAGWSADAILLHYYSGARITRLGQDLAP